MKNPITNSEIKSPGTLDATFPTLSRDQMTLYSTGDKQGFRGNGQFNAVVWPTSRWKTNTQTPSLSVLTSYICLICLLFWCDSI